MTKFVDVARLDHIIAGAAAVVTVGETAVALFDVNGRLYAVEDACMRCGSSIAAGLLATRQFDPEEAGATLSWWHKAATPNQPLLSRSRIRRVAPMEIHRTMLEPRPR